MNEGYQRSDNNNGNTLKVVIITVLVMVVLGLVVFLVLNNSTPKDNNVTNNENNNQNNSNNNGEVVTLDINSKQVKDITKLITNEDLDISPKYFDQFLFEALNLNNSSRYDLMMALTVTQLKSCGNEEKECDNKPLVVGDDYFNVYLDQKNMEDKFKEIFGPDVTFSHKSFDEGKRCGIPYFYDSKTKRYWGSYNCGGDGDVGYGVTYDLYKAEQKDDEIYTYWYIYQIYVDFSDRDLDEDPSYYIISWNSGNHVSDQLSSYEEAIKEAKKLKIEGGIDTYKITYKKQSDGKYYIHSGEWL